MWGELEGDRHHFRTAFIYTWILIIKTLVFKSINIHKYVDTTTIVR
jgi:hypothetical protein